MDIVRFTFQAAGFVAFVVALITLISHSVPGLDFLHANSAQLNQPMSVGFLAHLVAAIILGGIGYLLMSIGRKGS